MSTTYDATPRHPRGLFGLFNVTRAMQRGFLCGIRCHPVVAMLSLAPTAATLLVFAVLAWQFDVTSTQHWLSDLTRSFSPTATGWVRDLLPLVIAIGAVVPTICELWIAHHADDDAIVRLIAYVCVAFDLNTDWPVVSTFVDDYARRHPSQLGALEGVLLAACKGGLLLFATVGFAYLTCFLLAFLVGLLVATRQPQRR